ncbi:MAG TPA: hypothetical protein VKG92_08360 [Flavobacteriales bacterium]|nr:hypothetical protein [Flavobacteriales bacterium]
MARTTFLKITVTEAALPWALLFGSLSVGTLAFSQGKFVDRRDQAEGWYLPVHGEVLAEGQNTTGYVVHLYKNNEAMGDVGVDKKGHFQLELDIDQVFTLQITKPGYQEKIITIDTNLPAELVKYPDYECFVNLLPLNAQNIDPFYTDFPSAIVRYDAEQGGFYHSEHYLTHIQTKLAGYASASF